MLMEKQTLCERHLNKPATNPLKFKEAIGSLQYTAMISMPDINYAMGKLARYSENLSLIDWVGGK